MYLLPHKDVSARNLLRAFSANEIWHREAWGEVAFLRRSEKARPISKIIVGMNVVGFLNELLFRLVGSKSQIKVPTTLPEDSTSESGMTLTVCFSRTSAMVTYGTQPERYH